MAISVKLSVRQGKKITTSVAITTRGEGATGTMFLELEKLVELTDYKRSSDQIRWLQDRGYRFEISKYGRPKVLIDEVRAKMLSNPAIKGRGNPPRLDLVK